MSEFKLITLDTETTGLEAIDGDKIIEFASVIHNVQIMGGGEVRAELIDTYEQRINPERAINPKAQAVHGIAFEELVGKPLFAAVAGDIMKRLDMADVVIAHNLNFDAGFLAVEFNAAGLKLPTKCSVCTMEEGRWSTPNGKKPNLGELCFALEVEYDRSKAHAALYDITVTAQCFLAGLARGFYRIPEAV